MKKTSLKLKTLLFLLQMGTLLFSSTSSVAQSLEGKWIPAGENGIVMQFTQDSLIIYNLDKRLDAKSYIVKEDDINIGTNPAMILQVVTQDRLRSKTEGTDGSKDIVRLTPTKTNLTSAEIKKIAYFFSNDDKKRSFRFNEPNEDSEKLFKLEKIDSTYFLSQYSNNKRSKSASIQSITPEKIVVYLSPEKSMTLLGKDVDGNTVKTNNAAASIGEVTITEAIVGKWFYKSIEGRPPLSDCTKKTFLQFKENLSLETKPYAENHSNGNCIAGASINGIYERVGNDQIKIIQPGKTETWIINSLTKTKLVVERNGSALTLTKE